jgi:hypothetical protein
VTDQRQGAPAGYGAAIPYSEDIGHLWDISRSGTRLALEVLISECPWPGEVPGDFDALP